MEDTKLHDKIKELLEKDVRCNAWIKGQYSECYVRLSIRFFSKFREVHRTIEIGSITVKPKYKSKGIFTALLDFLENQTRIIVVECILEERLHEFLKKREFEGVPYNEQSYYKFPRSKR